MAQEYSLRIGELYMYAQEVTMPIMFQTRTMVEVPIQNGPPKWYYGAMKLRTFECTAKIYGKHEDIRDKLKDISNQVVPFVSNYIGSFDCMVEIEGDVIDGTEDVLYAKLKIQEVV
jgi:hypothetical protein